MASKPQKEEVIVRLYNSSITEEKEVMITQESLDTHSWSQLDKI